MGRFVWDEPGNVLLTGPTPLVHATPQHLIGPSEKAQSGEPEGANLLGLNLSHEHCDTP